MRTKHKVLFQNAINLATFPSKCVDLIVTSPPYPMIEMWDEMFCDLDPTLRDALSDSDGMEAFELMHQVLDPVWKEVYRILKEGRFACINVGDAVRTINGDFRLYTNHSRILSYLQELGFSPLPIILWRKPTNAPNKFMGSGMLPAAAYVTLEHEYILILRKGSKREFKTQSQKRNRRQSAYFWEERNAWFSDVWFDIKGTSQELGSRDTRPRSAAFPFELAYRLINMYSVKNDIVIDPFLGTGTTMAAAMASGRNCIGYEIDSTLSDNLKLIPQYIVEYSNEYLKKRLERHIEFSEKWIKKKGPMKYINEHYGFPIISSWEKELLINELVELGDLGDNKFEVSYSIIPQPEFCKN